MTEFDSNEVQDFRKKAEENLELAKEFIEMTKTEAFKVFVLNYLETDKLVTNLALARTKEERDNIQLILSQIGFIKNLLQGAEQVKANCEEIINQSDEELETLFKGTN